MRIANDGARRLCSIGFHPIFRIEGAADHLDPEDWIPVACGSGMPLARVPQGSAGTHTTYTIVNSREHHLPIPIGLEKVVHHEIGIPVHDQLELLSRWLDGPSVFGVTFDPQFLYPLESGAQTRTHHSAVSPQNGKVCQRSSRRRREP